LAIVRQRTDPIGTEIHDANKIYTFWLDRNNSWDELKLLSEADGGLLWWAKNGRGLIYTYGEHLDKYDNNLIVRTFNSVSSQSGLLSCNMKKDNEIYNYINVDGEIWGVYDETVDRYKPTRYEDYDAGLVEFVDYDTLWARLDAFPILGGQTLDFDAGLYYPARDIIDINVANECISGWSQRPIIRDINKRGTNKSLNLIVGNVVERPKRVSFTITNTDAFTTYVTSLEVKGKGYEQLLTPSAEKKDDISIQLFGKRNFAVSNKYIRSIDQADKRASTLLNHLKDNRMEATVRVKGTMGLDVWDVVEVYYDTLANKNLQGVLKYPYTYFKGRIRSLAMDYSQGEIPRMTLQVTRISELTNI
jgi:hypothetical protein